MPMINQQTPQMIGSSTTNKKVKNLVQQQQQQHQPSAVYKDQNMLTNSTMNGNSFLPKIYQQPSQETAAPTQNGYISDFYKQNKQQQLSSIKKARENNSKSDKNSNQYISDQSEKRSSTNNHNNNSNNNGYQSNGGGGSQNQNPHHQSSSGGNNQNSGQKLADKKFFRSKIDFMAPIKSLQNRQNNIDPLQNHLSDDSYYENPPIGLQSYQQQYSGGGGGLPNNNRHFLKGPPTIKGSDNEQQEQQDQDRNNMQNNHHRASSVSQRSGNQNYHQAVVNKYANLTQIQEETIFSTKSKEKFPGGGGATSQYSNSLNNSMMNSIGQNRQQNNNNYGLVSLNRNGLGYRKQSGHHQPSNNGKQNHSFIQNTNQIMGLGNNSGLKSTTNNNSKKFNNISMDQGYNAQRNNRAPPLKLPNLKIAYKKETLITHVQGQGHHGGGRLCAVCAKKHNPNQPHIVQSISPNKQKLLQRGPLYLNKSMSRQGGAIGNRMNQNNTSSQRSLSMSRTRAGSQSGRQLSLNNSQRSLLGSRSNRGGGGQIGQNNYNQIDRLRSVNKLRTIPKNQPSASEFSRNYKSLSPKVSMMSRGGGPSQQYNNQPEYQHQQQYQRPSQLQYHQTYQQHQQQPPLRQNGYNAMILTPKKTTIGKASFGSTNNIQNQNQNQNYNQKQNLNTNNITNNNSQLEEPELVCREKELDPSIEDEIKDGFFELRQKFKDAGGESSIYVSHVVLHAKHPIFCKLEIDTLKNLLTDSSIIYLAKDQVLYKNGSQDNLVYFVLFGRLNLLVPPVQGLNSTNFNDDLPGSKDDNNNQNNNNASSDIQSVSTQISIGKANIGWTVGEEVLYDKNMQIRQESCVAIVESCLLGIQKSKLAIIQKALLDKGNQKDYFVIESVLKGNYLIKNNWRKDMQEYYTNSVKSRSTPGQSQLGQDEINQINNNQNSNYNNSGKNGLQQQQQQSIFLT